MKPSSRMEQYEVRLRDELGNTWSLMFQAESFAHAEEQAWDALKEDTSRSEITSILRDW